jgi:glycyl-tRNA synthetase beta chain
VISGEDPRVALGIYEHYLPRFAEDVLPQTLPGTLVALADRLDTLVGCFAVGASPSGSVDPYGLRRAALGLIRLITENRLDLLLDETIQESAKLLTPVLTAPAPGKLTSQLLEFIAGRLKPLLLDSGLRYDVVDAVLGNFNDVLDTALKAKVLDQLAKESWFSGVVKSADRVYRIAKEAKPETVREHDLVDREEKALHELYLKVNWEVGEAVKKEDWRRAVQELAKLTDPLEQFFDKVLVMHQDERLKTNRLALLKSIETLYNSIADFNRIVIPGG